MSRANAAGKPVEGTHLDAVCLSANELDQAGAHGLGTGLGVREAENVLGSGVALDEDVCRPQAQELSLARARAGNHHQRAVQALHGAALLGVELLQRSLELIGHLHSQTPCSPRAR